jgi:hypothetical protein
MVVVNACLAWQQEDEFALALHLRFRENTLELGWDGIDPYSKFRKEREIWNGPPAPSTQLRAGSCKERKDEALSIGFSRGRARTAKVGRRL